MKLLRKENNIAVEDIAAALGVSIATIYRYENGDIEKMPGALLEPLARALKTTPAYLMGWEETDKGTATLPANILPLPNTRKIPLLGTIACGEPITATENINQYIEVADDIHCTFALRCKGDSMIDARIMDGDVVYIREQPQVENGEIAAVLIEDEATLKRVYLSEGVVQLVPCNAKYSPMVYTGAQLDTIRILGKAVAFTSLVR